MSKTIRVNTVYMVFEKLDNYYDDNDSTFVTVFDNSIDAHDYTKRYPQYDYYVQEQGIYKVVN